MIGIGTIKNGFVKVANHTKIGKRILTGIRNAKFDIHIEFNGVPSQNSKAFSQYMSCLPQKAPSTLKSIINDESFLSVLKKYAEKNKFLEAVPKNFSTDEIVSLILEKGGVGISKFAQMISSDKEIMDKLSPELQKIIKRTQSDNAFSRTLSEAQLVINTAFSSKQKLIGTIKENSLCNTEIKLLKQLSAGTVGEAYLARTLDGKEIIAKMIKKNVDLEQLQLEESILTRLISELAPNKSIAKKHSSMLHYLYKDWSKELDFAQEYSYNKLLQRGAKRYKVADIFRISKDNSCILMQKAEGIQMNNLLEMLKKYKSNPQEFFEKYAKEIKENPWLKNPQNVIDELPKSITQAFDEQFMFIKKGGFSVMHGDPHMGNYFITFKDGKLIPMFIDTGNCVVRDKKQISEDISFLANYFVGNSKGLAKYFVKQCKSLDTTIAADHKLLQVDNPEMVLVDKIAKEIQSKVFDQRANITDVDKIVKTMQSIIENNGLDIDPKAITAMKAQMQFYTGINETAALSGKTVDVATIVKDMPYALFNMVKNMTNPLKVIKDAIRHSYYNQEQASRCVYQFLAPKSDIYYSVHKMATSANTRQQVSELPYTRALAIA